MKQSSFPILALASLLLTSVPTALAQHGSDDSVAETHATASPEATESPKATETPKATSTPRATETPRASSALRERETETPKPSPTPKPVTKVQEAKNAALKTKAGKEIDRRVASLTELSGKLEDAKHVSESEKTALKSEIEKEVNDLKALKTKTSGATDTDTLKTDTKSIVDSYRVYALYMPKVRLLAAADALATSTANITDLVGKLEARIVEAKAKGADTAAMETSLTELRTKLADAKTQSDAIRSTVTPLTPEGYPANKTELEKARANLKTALDDLKTVRADAKTIVDALKKIKTTATPSPTAATE